MSSPSQVAAGFTITGLLDGASRTRGRYPVSEIAVADIADHPANAAYSMDPAGIAELAESIRQDGLTDLPLVRKVGDGSWQMVSGHRRKAAYALLAKDDPAYERMPCRVIEGIDDERAVTPERDAKLVKLRDFIAGKVSEPYNPGNRKVLVFSAFADTTAYLFEQLAPWLKRELGIECAEVAGSSNRTYSLKLPRTTFENILARFSPVSKELPESQRELGEIDVVFATDCISEGQNLQDCDCLVNYDIHWNPVRIIQRSGRQSLAHDAVPFGGVPVRRGVHAAFLDEALL